jgi:NTE family protein
MRIMAMDEPPQPRVALCLPGGGAPGAMYQIGALAALEDGVRGLGAQGFDLYLGHGTGASVAAALAGGIPVDRLYRALLDPVDNFFPIEQRHVLHADPSEWQGTASSLLRAFGKALRRGKARGDETAPTPLHLFLWELTERFSDTLPAGVFSLDRYERFLADFFLRRGVPNSFRALPRSLRVATHELDTGAEVFFGGEGHEGEPVSLACAASLATPLFFGPVRIGGRYYVNGGLGSVAHLAEAKRSGATLAIVVNPQVPVATHGASVPTGHGAAGSLRDKGLLGVFQQGTRITSHARLHQELAIQRSDGGLDVLVVEPQPEDAVLFLNNPANLLARRAMLEAAYRTTRAHVAQWLEEHRAVVERMGWG